MITYVRTFHILAEVHDNISYFSRRINLSFHTCSRYISKSSAEINYNAACTTGMYLDHFRMVNNGFLSKYPDLVPENSPLIILDSK